MAVNENVLQLTQQTGSANTSSVMYAAVGGTTDTGLPLSVFVNNLGLTGVSTAPTAAPGTNTTQIASTAFVQTATVGVYAPIANPSFTGTLTATQANEVLTLAPNTHIASFPGGTTDFTDSLIAQTNAGSHTTTSNSAFGVQSVVAGSGLNGPSFADYGATISVSKSNWPTNPTIGEIDGLTIITRQGLGDTDGILINAGGVGGFMGLIEGVISQFAPTTGTILKQMDCQIGSIETGLTGSPSSIGYLCTANTGTWDAGLQIQAGAGAGYTNAIKVLGNNNGAPSFLVTPAGNTTIGASGTSKTIRVVSNILSILNDAQSSQLLTLNDSGNMTNSGNFATNALSAITASLTNASVSGNTFVVNASSNTANGASVQLIGNGVTTPSKTIRAFGGNFQVVNDASTTAILSLTDTGGLTVTGSVTPSSTGGIVGTTTNNNATAGSVGEYVTATGGSTSVTTATPLNLTSISLTAGDWDVQSVIQYSPAGTTSVSDYYSSVNTTTATIGALGNYTKFAHTPGVPANTSVITSPSVRISIASTTTVFCVGQSDFSISTMTATGFIRARRVR